jgi:hypothetical protein
MVQCSIELKVQIIVWFALAPSIVEFFSQEWERLGDRFWFINHPDRRRLIRASDYCPLIPRGEAEYQRLPDYVQ